MVQVFISHIEEEQSIAEEIARGLEEAGYSVWYYERDSYPGPSYFYQIDNAISECQVVLVLISRKSVSSPQIKKEIEWAADKYKQFVPVLHGISWEEFQGERPPWRMALGTAVGVPISQAGVSAILPRIVRGLGHLGIQPATEVRAGIHEEITTQPPAARREKTTSALRELRMLEGHSAPISSVAVSANGQLVVSASWDQTLKIWDLGSGRELHTLKGHEDYVRGVAVSDDGRIAVSASNDDTLRVWDVRNRREVRLLEGHTRIVSGVAVSADGRCAVSASDDHTVKVWDLDNGRELRTLEGHSWGVWGVAISRDGRRAISASGDSNLKLWELQSGRELRTLAGHTREVAAVAMTLDGQRAISASFDHTLKVWDLGTGHELRTLSGHSDSVHSVAVMQDGQRAISASEDRTLRVWELVTGCEITSYGAECPFFCCTLFPDGETILAGDESGVIHALRLE